MNTFIIAISDTPSAHCQTFISVGEIDIDHKKKHDLILVSIQKDNFAESITACCRLYAMGFKAALLLLKSPKKTNTKNILGLRIIETISEHPEYSKAASATESIDRKNMLIDIYGHDLANLLLSAPSFEKAKKMIEDKYNDSWEVVLSGSEMHFSMKCIEEYQISRVDSMLIDKITAVPIFLAAMYGVFLFSVTIGGYLQKIFITFTNGLIKKFTPTLDYPLLTHLYKAITGGVETVLSFAPLLICMYFFIAILEKSGYMARATRMVDSMIGRLGLSGRAFVPLITGFGCNVPAITAASMLQDKGEKITTVMMAPFMACGARLSVFILLSGVFFADQGYNMVFILYLAGIMIALLTALIFKSKDTPRAPYISLPALCLPNPLALIKEALQKTTYFITGAGKMIFILFACIYMINIIPSNNKEAFSDDSILVKVSKEITPLFTPMGLKEDNWPAVAAIATGAIAKESIVGTMRAIYGDEETGAQQMRSQFNGKLGAFCYLLFVLLYFPCISVFITIAKQLNYRWAMISLLWSNFIAYSTATATYQISLFYIAHSKIASLITILIALALGARTAIVIKRKNKHATPRN